MPVANMRVQPVLGAGIDVHNMRCVDQYKILRVR